MGYNDDDSDDINPSDFRNQIKALNKKLAEAEQRAKELESKSRKADLLEVIADLKLNPKVARLIPSDVEPTKDAVKTWLDDYADLFGGAPTTNASDTQGDAQVDNQTAAPSVSGEYQNAMQLAFDSASTGLPPAPDPSGVAARLEELGAKNLPFDQWVKEFENLRHKKG